VSATVQERAWASPIWYTPTEQARVTAKPGTTVASLQQQSGTTALNDAELKDLIVGKSTWIRNNVTGSVFQVIWSTAGRRLITNVDGTLPQPGQIGDVMHSGELGSPSSYSIKDGKIVTAFGNLPYEVTVYKVGDKYFGARSNEYGYANYEIVPTPINLENLSLGQTERPPL
jgi:hypothetical protein